MSERLKQQVRQTADLLIQALTVPVQSLGLDLDGTIDENPHFFSILSRVWPGEVYVITFREDRTKAEAALAAFGIRYKEVVLVNSFAEKAVVIERLGIGIYIDDQDEVLMHLPESVTVLKVRNGGNYDHTEKKWLYSSVTGKRLF